MTNLIAREQIKSIIERVERLEEEAKALNEDKSEVYKEARGNGFNVKVLKRIIQRRRKDASEAEEEDALFDLYMTSLAGTDDATRARTDQP